MGHNRKIKGIMEVTLGSQQRRLVYDFPQGIKNKDEIEINKLVKGQKVKINCGVIYKMLLLPCQGPNTKWPNPLQQGIPKMCKNLVDEIVVLGKETW